MKKFIGILVCFVVSFAVVSGAFAGGTDSVLVSYLGPEGTYTEEAARFWFQDSGLLMPKGTVNDAITDVLSGAADFAVIPQENTLGGAVVNYVDALIAAEGAYVTGEVVLPISQTLMGVPGAALEDIRTVCSHIQGLTQSAQWRAENLPDAAAEEMASTAAAASYVAERQDKSVAAVAAPGAAPLYGLEVLAENVQITDENKTRFYILSDHLSEDESLPRAVFVVTCEGSRIADVIAAVRDAGLELVSLHDRPEGSSLGRYHYVIEAENSEGVSDEQVSGVCALDGVRFAGRFAMAEKKPAMADTKENSPALLSEYWTKGSAAMESINEYILAVTDEASPDYIPVEDRIAVFDLDGTLMSETYPFCFEYMVFADYALNSGSDTITDEVRAVAQEIVDAAGGAKPDGMSTRQAAAGAIAYKGMTMQELADVVAAFKESEAWGFSGMTRGEAYYKPMVELFEKLQENGFDVYVVTATERNIVREVIKGTLNIPPSHVIGTEYGYTATGQGDVPDTDYTFQPSDRIVFDGTYYGENAKTSKVDAIVREIGQQPVLAFGNSSGDLAMEIYTISGNPYKSAAYMVMADDEAREFGDAESAAKKRGSYEEMGIGIISMRDDFETIYGGNVKKTDGSADAGDTLREIFGRLTAEGSEYNSDKALYTEYYPDMAYEETLDENSFTVTVSGSEYLDGSWTFLRDGDYLTTTIPGDDYGGMIIVRGVADAVGEHFGMDPGLMNGYINGLTMLGIENDSFIMTTDPDDGTVSYQINIAGPWEMKELDRMVPDENVLFSGPLNNEYRSMACLVGKVLLIANGTADDITILTGEYGGLDDTGYRSMINAVSILQPRGWEDFTTNYAQLEDAQTDSYTVTLDPDKSTVADLAAEFINDTDGNISYAVIHFGE